MSARLFVSIFLAAWSLMAACLPAFSQDSQPPQPLPAPVVRSPEVVIPASMLIAPPARYAAQFPRGFMPGLGFGLNSAQVQADGTVVLHTLTGRGPTLEGPTVVQQDGRAASTIFILPAFNPTLVTMKILGDKAEVVGMLPLKDEEGQLLRGLPPASRGASNPVEVPLDLELKRLEHDPSGIDPQGVAYDFKRSVYWIADGYRPALVRISPRDGRVTGMYSAADGLEDILGTRRPGWGFTGVSVSITGKVYTMMRGVLFSQGKPAIFSRIVELDPDTERVRQIPYPIDEDIFTDPASVATGEVVAFADKRVLVLEQGIDKEGRPRSLVYAADLTQAHNIHKVHDDAGNTLESVTDKAQLRKMGQRMARKTLVLDLHQAGLRGEKAESMTLLSDGRTLVFMSGHGFGLEGQIAGAPAGPDGKPVLDASRYDLGTDGRLSLAGKPCNAVIGIRPTQETPRLWVAVLPKKVSDY
ncbi:MAG: esterase-like activity of phytase family protein [Acidobacteriota bacterium]